jgi:hypothetical protein
MHRLTSGSGLHHYRGNGDGADASTPFDENDDEDLSLSTCHTFATIPTSDVAMTTAREPPSSSSDVSNAYRRRRPFVEIRRPYDDDLVIKAIDQSDSARVGSCSHAPASAAWGV